jgi:hypothetical protein
MRESDLYLIYNPIRWYLSNSRSNRKVQKERRGGDELKNIKNEPSN